LLVEQEAMVLQLDQLLQLVVEVKEVKEVVLLHQEQLEQQILEEVEVVRNLQVLLVRTYWRFRYSND
jgi:hypothetical protein